MPTPQGTREELEGGGPLPADLDQLVRQAMSSGSTVKLEAAIRTTRGEASGAPARQERGEGLALRPPPAVRIRPVAAPLADHRTSSPFAEFERAAKRLLALRQVPGTPELDAAIREVEGALQAIRLLPPSPSAADASASSPASRGLLGPALPEGEGTGQALPSGAPPTWRHRAALVVEGPDDPELREQVGYALGLDGVTARILAASRHPRIAMRGDDPAAFEPLAERLTFLTRMRARVVLDEEIARIQAPQWVLGLGSDLSLRIATSGGEEVNLESDLLQGIRLAVPGEVVVRRYRAQRRRKASDPVAPALVGERRLGVLDLHAPGRFLRLLEGLTDWRGLPGAVEASAPRSLRGLVAWLAEGASPATALAARSCIPIEPPRPIELERAQLDGSMAESTGWALWEEHTRLCRLLLVGD